MNKEVFSEALSRLTGGMSDADAKKTRVYNPDGARVRVDAGLTTASGWCRKWAR